MQQSVCVRPDWVKRSVENLAKFSSSTTATSGSSEILVASVIGFHEGDYPLDYKLK
jgi:deoxyribose-phosphate aldolase